MHVKHKHIYLYTQIHINIKWLFLTAVYFWQFWFCFFSYQNEVEGQNTFKLLLVTSKRVSEEIYNTLANTLPFNFKLRLRFNAFKRFSHQHLNVIKQKKKKQQMHIIFILGVCISLPNCICISFGLVICMRRR